MEKARLIWLDGDLLPWNEANVHILTHTLHYGLGVFEGIRAYRTAGGAIGIFRLHDHIQRLFDSAHCCGMTLPFTVEELEQACRDTIARNGLEDCYLRPLAFYSDGEMGLGAMNPVRVCVAAFPWGAYLGKEGMEKGIRATISSYTRQHSSSALLRAKICGQYTTSILAKRLAKQQGYDEALFVDHQGNLAEGSGENIFLIKHGVLKTPPENAAILPGLTREAVLSIVRKYGADLGLRVAEEHFARDELFLADEVFLTGTAAEITPIRQVDNHRIGEGTRGSLTKSLQEYFFRVVQGKDPAFDHWVDRVATVQA